MMLLKELELICNESSVFCVDSQDLDAVLDHFPILKNQGVTAAIVTVENGEYTEAWFTTSSKPYDVHSAYYTVEQMV